MEGSSRSINGHDLAAVQHSQLLPYFCTSARPRRLLVALALLPVLSPPFATQTVPLPLEPSARIVGSGSYTVDLLVAENTIRP